MISFVVDMAWILVGALVLKALALIYHPCKVKRFLEAAPRLLDLDRLRGAREAINFVDPRPRESDSVSRASGDPNLAGGSRRLGLDGIYGWV